MIDFAALAFTGCVTGGITATIGSIVFVKTWREDHVKLRTDYEENKKDVAKTFDVISKQFVNVAKELDKHELHDQERHKETIQMGRDIRSEQSESRKEIVDLLIKNQK